MQEIFLITVKQVRQVKNGLTVLPALPGEIFHFDFNEKIRIEFPNGHTIENNAQFGSLFVTPPRLDYFITITNLDEKDLPVESKIFLLNKTEEEIIRRPLSADSKRKAIEYISWLVKDSPLEVQEKIIERIKQIEVDEN